MCRHTHQKQEKIASLIELLNNGPILYMLTYEGDILNYLGVAIKKNSNATFELS